MIRSFSYVFILLALVSELACQDFVFPEDDYSPWAPKPPIPKVPSRFDTMNKKEVTMSPKPINRVGDRISQKKCEEFSKLVEKTSQFSGLTFGAESLSLESDKCNYTSTALVVGGENTQLGEFPHMAAIGYKNLNGRVNFKCGGSLVSERFVLTAAHCETSERAKPSIVRLGEHDLATRDRGSPEIDIPIEKFIRHEKYNRVSRENDVGLIKLIRDVEFSEWIRPACIAQPAAQLPTEAVALGWGYTEVGGQTSDVLQKVLLSIIPNDKCRNVYNDIENYQVFPSQLCAGELVGGKDTCGGDSGGPLQTSINQNECIFKIVGITSYGSTFCGAKNSPGIYTRVASYTDWIEKNVWPQ